MAKEKISSYELSRWWFDWCFENPELVNPSHSAIFFFAIEHCNRLGWKEKFGFPTQMAMDAIGIKKHQTYIKYFTDLCEWGFLKLIQKSANQYSANIISLANAKPKSGKALDKAFINHAAKQTETNGQSTGQSKDSINKQYNNKQYNNKQEDTPSTFLPFNSDVFSEAWESWKKYRIAIRKPYATFSSEQAELTVLGRYSENDALEMIKTALKNGWKNIRPLDLKPGGSKLDQPLSINEMLKKENAQKYGQ